MRSGLNRAFILFSMATEASSDAVEQKESISDETERLQGISLEEKSKLDSWEKDDATLEQIATWSEFAARYPYDGECNSKWNVWRLSVKLSLFLFVFRQFANAV